MISFEKVASSHSGLIPLKTVERMIYKVLSIHYMHRFPPLAAVCPLG